MYIRAFQLLSQFPPVSPLVWCTLLSKRASLFSVVCLVQVFMLARARECCMPSVKVTDTDKFTYRRTVCGRFPGRHFHKGCSWFLVSWHGKGWKTRSGLSRFCEKLLCLKQGCCQIVTTTCFSDVLLPLPHLLTKITFEVNISMWTVFVFHGKCKNRAAVSIRYYTF